MTPSTHFESSFHSFTRLLDADFNFHREFRLLVTQRSGLKMENRKAASEWMEPTLKSLPTPKLGKYSLALR